MVEANTSRRSFLKWSAVATAAGTVLPACTAHTPTRSEGSKEGLPAPTADRTVWSACLVNCGSRCPLRMQVKDGTIVQVLPDNTGDDGLFTRQIRACVRGRSMRQRIYSPDRIKTPLIRVEGTKRGAGKWRKASWDEALDLVVEKLRYTYDKYGPEAVYRNYGSGVWNAHVANSGGWNRLFNLLGGRLTYYGNYSYAQIATITRYFYGSEDEQVSNSFEDAALHSDLLVLWGNNPQETRMSGGGLVYTSLWAKIKGKCKIIVVDPRYSDSAAVLADEWVAPRPGTDSALIAGMIHVMLQENLQDQAFLDKYCIGFDEDHMPEGAPKHASYRSYIEGKGPDGVEKTPEWAARITGVPADQIRAFARQVANAKACNISQGWGPQRHANGEHQALAIYLLACVTGNVGIPGGGTGGREGYYWPITEWFDDGENPVKTSISCFGWTDAIDHGPEMTATKDGVRGADRLKTGIKFLLNYGSNMPGSQHADINRTRKILQDESKCEFILAVDNQMTRTTELADVVLPDTTQSERWDLIPSEYTGDMAYLILTQKVIEPLYESRPAFEIVREIAKRMGLEQEFSEGRDLEATVRRMHAKTVAEHPQFPDFDQMLKQGVYRYSNPEGTTVALKEFREDPEANPLDTPSGKIEIYSQQLADMAKTWEFPNPLRGDQILPIPAYQATWEGAEEAKTNREYPLQCIGHHYKQRTHSTYGNLSWLNEAHPQSVWINTLDAQDRGIKDGSEVLIYNPRGKVQIPAKVTARIAPGVISLPQGAWTKFDEHGVDHGGAVNVLTSQHPTPISKGNGQHTTLVQVKKAR
ncbi:molybdopterin-dependent oxidoreductase [Gleimia hominis]|uniref:Molybdopterin-dependent oxidoreductase n=1 Tax=Gleimia hominis TaxID=595468 RepID=A0ABU3IAH5_9ACTO|nr:DMSO/selenate family reductase complex A subunit [Gleimia hominis]MDT3767372.1 molybdopterin-dependent oxidoreductase [Gleimia hominis]